MENINSMWLLENYCNLLILNWLHEYCNRWLHCGEYAEQTRNAKIYAFICL
jgi:hypothetical protein